MKISNQVILALQNYHKTQKEGELGLVIVDQSKQHDQFFTYLGFEKREPDIQFLPTEKVNQAINKINLIYVQVKNITDLDEKMWKNISSLKPKEVNETSLESSDTIKLFNPFRDRIGRFASGPGGGGSSSAGATSGGGASGGGSSSSELKSQTISKASKLGGIIKTTGKVLGLTGLGLVGLAVLSSLGDDDEAFAGPKLEPIESDEEQKRAVEQQLEELTKSWPDFKNANGELDFDRAVNTMKDQLRQNGFNVPDDLIVMAGPTPAGTGGFYDPTTNQLTISRSAYNDLAEGNPAATWTLMHELAHANQESDNGGWGDGSQMEPGQDSQERYLSYLEGQNDLATAIAMSDMYGQPISQESARDMGNRYSNLRGQLNSLDYEEGNARVTILGGNEPNQISELGYSQESRAWAAVATLGAQQSGTDPVSFLSQAHSDGMNPASQHQVLMNVFPNQMTQGGFYTQTTSGGIFGIGGTTSTQISFPPSSTIAQWAREQGVDPEQAFFMILNGAAQ